MSEDLKGWSRPEEKFPEAELEDSFAEYFAEDHASVPGKKQKRRRTESGPDLLIETASEDDPGFVIEGLAASEQAGSTTPSSPEDKMQDTQTAETGEEKVPAEERPSEGPGTAETEIPVRTEGPESLLAELLPERAAPEAESLPDEPFMEEESGPAEEALPGQPAGFGEKKAPGESSGEVPSTEKASGEVPSGEVPSGEEASGDVSPAVEASGEVPPVEELSADGPKKTDTLPEAYAAAPAAKPKKLEILRKTQNLLWNRRKHRWAAPVGLVVIILAVIGFIAVIIGGLNLSARVIDNTKEKETFAWKIYPLLIFDPAAFDDPSQLDHVFLLKTALWKTLLENRTKYSYNDDGMLVVPASDLNVAAKSLYGDTVKLDHQTFSEGYEYYYIYDESISAYLVPVMGQTAEYTPDVVRITKTEDTYTLLVGYVTQSTLWNMDTEGNLKETFPSKYMYYDLKKLGKDNYIITAVREVPADEVPETENSDTQQQLNETRYGEILGSYGNTASYNSTVEKYLSSGASEPVSGESQTESAAEAESTVSEETESSLEESVEETAD